MRIFLSYANEQVELAKRLRLGLEAAGHDVFFDHDDLPPAETYDDRIRKAVLRARLFIFLASRESLERGAYALTELSIMESRGPRPGGRVLPVVVDSTPIEALPPYLRAVSVLVPRGDAVAETLNVVAGIGGKPLWQRLLAIAAIGAVVVFLLWFPGWVDEANNPRGYRLQNGARVRMIGKLVANDSSVEDDYLRWEVEYTAWRYNRCYDRAFGQLSGDLPQGTVRIGFDVHDQHPSAAALDHSEFEDDAFNRCVLGTLQGQTLDRAPGATGHVSYAFEFVPEKESR